MKRHQVPQGRQRFSKMKKSLCDAPLMFCGTLAETVRMKHLMQNTKTKNNVYLPPNLQSHAWISEEVVSVKQVADTFLGTLSIS